MHPQKKFVQAVADMEQALAETLQAFTKKRMFIRKSWNVSLG